MKKKIFNKNEIWDCFTYYDVIEKNGDKYIKFYEQFDRGSRGKEYLSWLRRDHMGLERKISDLIEWDIYYALAEDAIFSDTEYSEIPPQKAFELSNKALLFNSPDGRIRLDLIDIDEDTPCGHYYGI